MTHRASTTHRSLVRLSLRQWGIVVLALGIALFALVGPTPSSAVFTASTGAAGQVSAAADWTPPTVKVTSPGVWVKGIHTVEIAAADTEGPVARVILERRATGTQAWVSICTDASAPFSCAWDTRDLTDGQYDLRARATDTAGLSATSAVVRTTVANLVTAVLTAPGAHLRGTVTLGATLTNVGSLAHTIRIQHAAPGSSASWTTICTDLRSPYACSWDTTTVSAGARNLRAVALDSDGRTLATSASVSVTVDNVDPSITLADPGSPLSGTRTFSTTATDAHAGVQRVVVQHASAGTSTWRDLCTITASPWNCSVVTSTLPDGAHSFRAVATDRAGNTATSAVVLNRLVENTAPTVTLTTLPAVLRGTVEVGATASSVAGVTSVTLQQQRSGGSWTDLCTDTTAPYSCDWHTMPIANGAYSLRAVMSDALGRTTTSATVNRSVDNPPFAAVDVQTANGTGTAGRPDSGDTVTFTFSHEIDLSTVMAGWNGSSRAVTARFNDDARTIFVGSKEDTLEVLATDGSALNLGSVNLMGDYIRASRTADFSSTLRATTATAPDGTARTTLTLTLGTLHLSGFLAVHTTVTADPGHMVWTPSTLVKDVYGRFSASGPVTETGQLDREF